MHIELVESIRCPGEHAFTWLVAETASIRNRDIEHGMLGCPECRGRYPIAGGVLDLRRGGRDALPGAAPAVSGREEQDAAVRVAALLGLETPGGVVVLAGGLAGVARALAVTLENVHLLVVNPAVEVRSGAGISIALTDGQIPLRDGTSRGIALDEAHAAASQLDGAARALLPGGRLLAPVHAGPVPGLRELARDDHEWLAERPPAPPVVPLGRSRQ